jgi:methionyl-tRNA synthetase
MTGTDEHGIKIQKRALEEVTTPQELCDRNSKQFKDLCLAAEVTYDDFIRTSEPRHIKNVQEFWKKLKENG